jgi:hypothetical protein
MRGAVGPFLAMAMSMVIASKGAGAQTLADNLGDFRALAEALRKRGPGGDTAAVCEYHLDRPSNACARDLPESRTRLRGDGRLDKVVTRSFAETEDYGPGRFAGRIGKAQWDSAFAALAAMRWAPRGPLPMPGMSQGHALIVLRLGGKEAEFSFAGGVPPGQDAISAGLSAAARLASAAERDTLWALRLSPASPGTGKAGLSLQSLWTLRGTRPIRVRLPRTAAAASPACGSLELAWHVRPVEKEGVTSLPPEIHRASLKVQPPSPGAWKDLRPGDTLRLPLDFPLPDGKSPRSGRLTHLGMAIVEPGGTDSLAITLFSEAFDF